MPGIRRRTLLGLLGGAAAAGVASCSAGAPGSPPPVRTGATPTHAAPTTPPDTPADTSPGAPDGSPPASPTTEESAGAPTGTARVTGIAATGLNVPWGLARMPDGTVLVTSRDEATVHEIRSGGRVALAGTVPGVVPNGPAGGEAGLLGLALSPSFTRDRLIYLFLTSSTDNRIVTVRHTPDRADGKRLGEPSVVFTGIPRGFMHNGGRLAFGPDRLLYVGTGETGDRPLAQDRGSLAGKILRLRPDGRPAVGNPFGTAVYSYGHRNVQGLAFDPSGRLWASELGDRGADELNLIRAGHNYGWPDVQGKGGSGRFTDPVAQFGTEQDSPSGIAYAAGCIWMAGLKGERLWRIPLDGDRLGHEPTDFLVGDYGRLRAVLALDDHTLLVSTSNTDHRGSPRAGDDRVLHVAVS